MTRHQCQANKEIQTRISSCTDDRWRDFMVRRLTDLSLCYLVHLMNCFSFVFSSKLSVGFKRKAQHVPAQSADGELRIYIYMHFFFAFQIVIYLVHFLLILLHCSVKEKQEVGRSKHEMKQLYY